MIFLYFLFLINGIYINNDNINIVPMLFPDSNQPFFPIPSIYVDDDVFVSIDINIDIIYIEIDIITLFLNFFVSLSLKIYMYINKFNII